jgi:4-hydroxybutyrate CoA-transferase
MSDLSHYIKPESVVYVAGSCAEPRALVERVRQTCQDVEGVRYIQQPLGAVNQTDLSALTPGASQRTFFMTPFLKEGRDAGRVAFVPMHMRTIFDYLAGTRIDVALLQAARDREGRLRYGPNVDYLDAVIQTARHVILEENTSFAAPLSAPLVDEASVDLVIKLDSDKPLYPVGESDEVSERIGALIAHLIKDGDCLQTGIGAVPAAILANLGDRNDLGFHGGLMDEGVMMLINEGNINGSVKNIDRGKHVLGMALGSERLLDWLAQDDRAENVIFRSADYTHDFGIIRQLDNFVSINSAVEVDLMGQVNAEVTGGRQISGTGGSVDFMRSAKASKGGRSIVAMSSTARGGTVSRIVSRVPVVTALRTDIDLVVTEYGIADLRNESLESRAARLIAIAHPDFRDQLTEGVNRA